jgi:hypothetical protein
MSAIGVSGPAIGPPPVPSVEHVRRLVEAHRVDEARRYIEDRRGRGDTTLESWAELLAPPVVRSLPAQGRGDFVANMRWVRENREQFLGCWVALREGQVVGADRTLRALCDRLKGSGQLDDTLVVKVE